MPRLKGSSSSRSHKKHVRGNKGDAKATKKSVDIVSEKDVFNFDMPLDRMTDICRLCNGDQIDGEIMQRSFQIVGADDEPDIYERHNTEAGDTLDPESIWAARYSLQGKYRSFTHFYCALYCPLVEYYGVSWSNLRKEIVRGRCLQCYVCHEKGSTIKCSSTRCNYTVHLPCALKEGFVPTRFVATPGYFCPTHLKVNEEEELKLDSIVETDLSAGREVIPLIMKNDIDDLPFPTNFE